MSLAAVAGLLLISQAGAETLTDAQNKALHALEIEFDVHAVTGTEEERSQAFQDACEAGYNLACQRGAWVVYGKPDLETAANLFGSACESGDRIACMVTGWNYDRGAQQSADRDRNWRQAAKIFKAQCDDGFTPACFDWGWFLYQNKGFKADPRAGVQRWKQACTDGNMASCSTLGVLAIDGGNGVKADRGEALSYLSKACEGGFPNACFHQAQLEGSSWTPEKRDEVYGAQCDAGHRESCWTLAQSYLSGDAKAPSEERLDALLNRGCDVGSGAACYEAGRREMSRDSANFDFAADRFDNACEYGELSGCTSLVELITGGRVQGSVKTAPLAFETACLKRNSPVACTELAMELMRGVDLPRDPARARALLHRACVSADSAARPCNELARSYADALGGHRDRTTASKYYRWACDGGIPDACEARGDLLALGKGIVRDDYDALAMYTKACELGLGSACTKAGVILDEGTFVERDSAKAGALYQKACDAGNGAGCHGLGRMLEEGAFGTADPEGARGAYDRGIALGSVDAQREQARLLWNGIGGKKQRGRARKLAADACQKGDALACHGAEGL